MVDPKNEPGFEPKHDYPEHQEKNQELKPMLRQRWRDRMSSKLVRMSQGAQNIWRSLSSAHKDNWRRKKK